MIDNEKIPETTTKQLIELFGLEKAEKIIIENQYNYHLISNIILEEKLVRFFRVTNFRNWLVKKTKIQSRVLLILLLIIGFLIYTFWSFFNFK